MDPSERSRRRLEFWLAAVSSWLGYPVTAFTALLVQGQDATWLWPGLVTAGWAVAGLALASTKARRAGGLGLLVGLGLGFLTAVVLLVVALGLLAHEIGYS